MGQLLIGLINGAFYAMLSLGLAVIFGLLNIINFAHGAQYMLGAFVAYFALQWTGLGYWWSLLLAPIVVGLFGIVLERTMLKRLYHLDHLYGLLLTFGIALIVQGVFRHAYGSSGLPYGIPPQLSGGYNLGFMFLPTYRAWGIVFSLSVCLATLYVIGRTPPGASSDPFRSHRFDVHAGAPAGGLRGDGGPARASAVLRLPGVPDEGALLRAVRLRLQPAHRLRGPAVVRPRGVPGRGRLRLGA